MLPNAQVLILVAWIVVGLVLVGLGLGVRRLAGIPSRGADDLLQSFWIGWSAAVLALQVWHLALPVDLRATAMLAAAGVAGIVAGGIARWHRLLRGVWRNLPAVVVLVALALWLSNRALAGPRYGDTGAYFVPTVRWLVAYPIVPGLGNLRGHYALNQSYFLYVAALEVGPFAHRSWHVANGLLVLALAAHVALATGRLLRRAPAGRAVDLFWMLMAPGVLPIGVGLFLTSPSPDVAVFALGAVASAELLALTSAHPDERDVHLQALVLFAVTGITVKLSFVGLALGLLPVALLVWFQRARPTWTRAARAVAIATVLGVLGIGPWIARNVVMSGMPLFPSAVVVLPVEWRVQFDMEGWLRNTVYMGGVAVIMRDPRWFAHRLAQLGWTDAEMIGPIVVGLAGAVVAGIRRLAFRSSLLLPLVVIVPALASLAYCVLLSPMPRYSGATVWLLAALGVLLAMGDGLALRTALRRIAVVLAAAAALGLTVRTAAGPLWLALRDFETVGRPPYAPQRLESGLVVNVPAEDACWEAPLPCTPFVNPALRLRRAGDLGAGFMVDPVLQERYHYEPGAPWVERPK